MTETIETPNGPHEDGDVIVRTSDDGGTYLRRLLETAEEWANDFPVESVDWAFADTYTGNPAAVKSYCAAYSTTRDEWYDRLRDAALKAMSDRLPDGWEVRDGRYGAEIIKDGE